MRTLVPQPIIPTPKRKGGKPRRESIEKSPPRRERGCERNAPEDGDPSRTPRGDFDPNVNSTRT